MQKNLTRSREDRMIAGVIGGLGEFFGLDPVLLRLAYVTVTVFTGFFPGVLCYALAVLIVPDVEHAPGTQDDTNAL